jgi:hypothetical protein
MAALVFLLAPTDRAAVREEYDEEWFDRCYTWIHEVWMVWYERYHALPEAEQKRAARGYDNIRNISTNAAHVVNAWAREYRPGVEALVAERYDAWKAAGYSGEPPSIRPADFARVTGTASGMSWAALTSYRSDFAALAPGKVSRGWTRGFFTQKAPLDQFKLAGHAAPELVLLEEIARISGGDHLAMWTYGQALHLWLARGSAPREVPVVRGPISVRLLPPREGRHKGWLDGLRAAFEGSAIQPDWEAIAAQHAAAEISVRRWFEAFGVPGVRELRPEDAGALWADLEAVAQAHLRGEAADKDRVKRLNVTLGALDDRTTLKAKPPTKPGATAVAVAAAEYDLRSLIGPPESPAWVERRRAAALYGDITEGDEVERLTVGKGLGASASLGRLLGYYPAALARDAIFLALASLEAEAANGHAYVVPLAVLAENAHAAGFTLAIVPAKLQAKLRRAFGIERGETAAPATGDAFAAEAFVDLPKLLKAAPAEALAVWFAKAKADGAVVRAEADGVVTLTAFRDGMPTEGAAAVRTVLGSAPDEAALRSAARAFLPRAAFAALGLPDLLEPGAWQEDAHRETAEARDSSSPYAPYVRAAIEATTRAPRAIAFPAQIREIGTLISTRERKFRFLDVERNQCTWTEPERLACICSVRVSLPTDARHAEEIAADIRVDVAPWAWVAGSEVYAFSDSTIDMGLLACVIGDAPPGTRITVDEPDGHAGHFEITG